MSATTLAAFIVAAATAAVLGIGAAWIVHRNRNNHDHMPTGLAALGLGLLAVLLFGVGGCMADRYSTGTPALPPGPVTSCQPGTYDNGDTEYDHPHCFPWPNGRTP